ncbi:MAG: aminopeptidase, partial [Lachnospiraceae bacterium]|nr:aminopeptidase [Lachnospiraceae bacterium]
MERKNAWNEYGPEDMFKLEETALKYRRFLDKGKTERECVTEIIAQAEAAGFRNLDDIVKAGETLKPGDKVYAAGMKKIVALFTVGSRDIAEGMNILCAHIDSPRLDIKQNPLYEDTDLAYLDTHYYGGVKKYQWVTIPLAIHGVVVKKDGTVVEVCIGEDEDDPIVYITDLLIHLSAKQLQKKAAEVIEGESLDILIGSRPLSEIEDDK